MGHSTELSTWLGGTNPPRNSQPTQAPYSDAVSQPLCAAVEDAPVPLELCLLHKGKTFLGPSKEVPGTQTLILLKVTAAESTANPGGRGHTPDESSSCLVPAG